MAADIRNTVDDVSDEPVSQAEDTERQTPSTHLNLVKDLQRRIRADKKHHEPAFEQMRRNMFIARHGRPPEYPKGWYKANLAGRHVKQKTAALYAKNPKAVARRRETLDFEVWDEKPQSLQMAMQTLQIAQQLLNANPGATDIPPEMQAAFTTAQATVADYQQGMQKRQQIDRVGKTLEILFAQSMREQKPVDFKTGMKQCVRRALTACVGYVELAFQREYGPRPTTTEQLADFRARLDHLRRLSEEIGDTENPVMPDDSEIAQLELAVEALQNEPEVVLREGLILDFPQATKVIPDMLCRNLVGFIGARHVTVEYMFTADQVKEMFGVDLKQRYTGYSPDGKAYSTDDTSPNIVGDDRDDDLTDDDLYKPTGEKGTGLVCVWKHYDKAAGLVYYLADGYSEFLRDPAAPDVFVEDFWPIYALTFNEVESESELFPPSDVELMFDMQMEYNRSRQGMNEHRKAARPRYAYAAGRIEEKDVEAIADSEAFSATGINIGDGEKIGDILQVVPVPGVDPNLYETGQLFTDIQLTVGSQEAQFGGLAKATATESAIAANASASSDGSSVDDLDAFLTVIARGSSQILLREMSPEHVKEVAGVGAVWPDMTLSQIADEIFLEVEAGSTGKPNQAVEIDNWQKMLPFLIQMKNIDPNWLAREAIRRLDDRLDLTEAIAEGTPSLLAQNQLDQISTGDPATDPNAQAAQGDQNAPRPTEEQRGSEPAFGSNQV